MKSSLKWLRNQKFISILAFFLMALPPIPMYSAAERDATLWMWGLIGVVVLGNLIVLLIR